MKLGRHAEVMLIAEIAALTFVAHRIYRELCRNTVAAADRERRILPELQAQHGLELDLVRLADDLYDRVLALARAGAVEDPDREQGYEHNGRPEVRPGEQRGDNHEAKGADTPGRDDAS